MKKTTTITEVNLFRRIVGRYAEIKATKDQAVAWFSCPGTGTSEHCFGVAESLARAAGFRPLMDKGEIMSFIPAAR